MNIKKGQTPEQKEYEETAKKMRILTAKMRIAQEGIDVSSISQQKLGSIMRTFDDMEQIHRDIQQKKSKIQQDANISTQKVDQDANKKFIDIQKRYQDIIKSLKDIHPQIQQQQNVEVANVEEIKIEGKNEEIREKTHEEKVSEITDIVLKAMRNSVSEKVDEIMRIIDEKAEFTVGKGINYSEEILEELVDHTKQLTVEAAIVGNDEKPDEKDIPIITPEMIKKTEEDIVKRRQEEQT